MANPNQAERYQSWCFVCITGAHFISLSDLPTMMSTYVLTAKCDHCGRMADLALVDTAPEATHGD